MMTESNTERRLGQLESEFALVKHDVTAIGRSLAEFREEWSSKAEEDRKAHRNARMTFPQFAGLLFGAVTMTAVLLGGLMWLINVQTSSVRSDLANQVTSAKQSAEAANAQTGLTVRGMVDGITALNNGMQTMQREQAADRVKLGLVEQQAVANPRFIEQAQAFDALMARHDERLKALEQAVHEIAALALIGIAGRVSNSPVILAGVISVFSSVRRHTSRQILLPWRPILSPWL